MICTFRLVGEARFDERALMMPRPIGVALETDRHPCREPGRLGYGVHFSWLFQAVLKAPSGRLFLTRVDVAKAKRVLNDLGIDWLKQVVLMFLRARARSSASSPSLKEFTGTIASSSKSSIRLIRDRSPA
jgi:hypothetical protein